MSQNSNTSCVDIVPCDRRFRLRMLILCALFVLAAGYAVFGVHLNLRRQMALAEHDSLAAMENMVAMVRWVAVSAGVVFVGFAMWFAWLGARVLRFGQYPPPGVAVMRDTRIRRGLFAQMLGGLAILYCVLLFLLGIYGAWRFENAMTKFIKHDIAVTSR